MFFPFFFRFQIVLTEKVALLYVWSKHIVEKLKTTKQSGGREIYSYEEGELGLGCHI